MKELNLSLVASKIRKLKDESENRRKLSKEVLISMKDVVLLNFLSDYMSEVEENSGTYSNRKSLLSVKLVNEFLNVANKRLEISEFRMKKEDPKFLMNELRLEIEECLIITSNFIFQVSKCNYYRGLLSREFPNIFGVMINIASSNLLGIQLRCQILEAILELMKNQSNDKISQSISLRRFLSKDDEKVLSKLWKSLFKHKNMYLTQLFDQNKDFDISSSIKQEKYNENSSIQLTTLILQIYSNILHFQRYLTDKVLQNVSIEILCGNYLDLLFDLSITSIPKVDFLSGIILRSLLLDSTESQYQLINNKIKSSRVLLIYLARIINEGFINNVEHANVDNCILYAQIISILSQYDIEIYEFITRIFPKKFFKIFENRWFRRQVYIENYIESQANLNILPWFPVNCSWYDMRTNVLVNDTQASNYSFIDLKNIKSKILNYNFSALENILNQSKNKLFGNLIKEYNIDNIIQEYFEKYCHTFNESKDLIIQYYNSIFKGQNNQYDYEYTIRRYPDFTWYLFWNLCKNDYQDQLDLIWDQTVKNEVISILIKEYNQNIIRGPSKSDKWSIVYFFPEIPKISKEIQISDSVYFRLLIPTLMKMHKMCGLFHYEKDMNRQFNNNNSGLYLDLKSSKTINIGNLTGCNFYFTIKKSRYQNKPNKFEKNAIQECNNFKKRLGGYFGFVKNKMRNFLVYNQNIIQDKDIGEISLMCQKMDEGITIKDIIINNNLNDWQILENNFDNYFDNSNNYLNEQLFKKIIYCQIPFLECIENVEKVRILIENLFQKVISETSLILKSYMLYGYMYYIVVFNEYLPGIQIMGHLQYLLSLLISENENDQFYRGLVTYILHIILSIYEEVRQEFIKIGGLLLINEFLMNYQKSWSVCKQLSIYNDENIFREIRKELETSKKEIEWERYVNIFQNRESQIYYFKLFDEDIQKELLSYENDKFINNKLYLNSDNEEKINDQSCTDLQVFILNIPEINDFIKNGLLSSINQKLILRKINSEEIRTLNHKQYMNIWMMIMNEDQLRISIRDYLNLNNQIESIISEIPSEINTDDCFNSINCVTPNNYSEFESKMEDLFDKSSNQAIIQGKQGLLNRMNNYDLINYRELLIWLITINNCIIQSKIWLSKIINNESSFGGIIKIMINLLLNKNKIQNFNIIVDQFELKENYHIYWISKIFIQILKSDPDFILRLMEYKIIEILIMIIMRFDSNNEQQEEIQYIIDEVIKLFRLCLISMNKLNKEYIINNYQLIQNHKDKESKLKCNSNCNLKQGCIYGDIICLIYHAMEDLGIQSNIEIDEYRMIQIFGNGIFYASRYIPISILQILNINNDIEYIDYFRIIEFKKSLGLLNNYHDNKDQIGGIRIRWDYSKRIALLINLSKILYYQAIEIDNNNNNYYYYYYYQEFIPSMISDYNNIMDIDCNTLINGDHFINRDLNIYGYYLNSLSKRLRESRKENIDYQINQLKIFNIKNNIEIMENLIQISREKYSQKLIGIMELDLEKMTIIFQNQFYKKFNFSHQQINDNINIFIYKNLWNILQYYLYIYTIYYINMEEKIQNENNKEQDFFNLDNILENIIKLLELQKDLFIMGISLINDNRIRIIEKEIKIDQKDEKLFNQLIDVYYQTINNNIKENIIIIYYLDLCKIIGEKYIINNYYKEKHCQIKRIYNISSSIINLIEEYNIYCQIKTGLKLFLEENEEKNIDIEKRILIKILSKEYKRENIELIKNVDLLNKNNIIIDLLLKCDTERIDSLNQDKLMLNLILYRIYQKIKKKNNNDNHHYHEQFKDSDIFDLLVIYLINIEKEIDKIITVLFEIIKEYIKYDFQYILRGVKLGLISKLMNILISKESIGISMERKKEIFEILLLIYKGGNNNNNNYYYIKKIFESILTPAICRIIENNDINCELFIRIINSEIITNQIIWTKGMYDQLLKWTLNKDDKIDNDEIEIIDYRERYYKVVNNDLGDERYNFLKEEYIIGIYKSLYILGYENNNFNIIDLKIRINIGEIFDKVFQEISKINLNNIYDYLCFLNKLIKEYGIKECLIYYGKTNILEKIKIIKNLLDDKQHKNIFIKYFIKEEENKMIEKDYIVKYLWEIIQEIVIQMEEENIFQKDKNVENTIKIEINKIIIKNIIYIQENYFLKKYEKLINIQDLNNEINNNEIQQIFQVLNKLMKMYKYRGLKGLIDSEYENLTIFMTINIMLIIFKYENILRFSFNSNHNNNNCLISLLIKEMVNKYIDIIKEEIINCGYNNNNNNKYLQELKLVNILEMIIYPLSKSISRKLRKLLTQDEQINNINEKKTITDQFVLKMIKNLMNKEKSIIDLIIMSTNDQIIIKDEKEITSLRKRKDKEKIDFLEWFINDHKEIMFEWNDKIKEQVYVKMINIKKRINKYFEIYNNNNNNNPLFGIIKSDEYKFNYDLIKKIIKFENYINMIKEYKQESIEINLDHIKNNNDEMEFGASICSNLFNNEIERKYKDYILKLINIREINNLTILLLKNQDHNNNNNNNNNNLKKKMMIELILIKKFKDFYILIMKDYGIKMNYIKNNMIEYYENMNNKFQFYNNNIIIDENCSILNEEKIISNNNLLFKKNKQNDRIYRIGNIHPNLRELSSMIITSNNNENENETENVNENNNNYYFHYNKIQVLMIINDMIQILLCNINNNNNNNNKLLLKLVDNILVRIILLTIENIEDDKNDFNEYNGINLNIELIGQVIIEIIVYFGKYYQNDEEIKKEIDLMINRIKEIDEIELINSNLLSLFILKISQKYKIFNNQIELNMFKDEIKQLINDRMGYIKNQYGLDQKEIKENKNENEEIQIEQEIIQIEQQQQEKVHDDYDPINNAMMIWEY
ncbi:Uncharacterized protein cmbei_300290 [Cryptosporidium meleagridis]